ncbi:MAG: Asp-tRNA(Asn)/Glu-tRNA(Gln) amidotransferase subunit GatB [Acidobacteria bacterium]|nr:MAG: Asp-tRNA(Asn)/Glu-tRNA(Gln) amidotransferase subunit GatB [Acidobacteriota bacterium]
MFSRADVERIARLARLELTNDEKDLYARQLADILEYAAQVQAVDTADVAPTALGVTGTAEWREDRVAPSLPRDEVLRAAPAADLAAGLFKVPRVLGS